MARQSPSKNHRRSRGSRNNNSRSTSAEDELYYSSPNEVLEDMPIFDAPNYFCARPFCGYGWECYYIHVYYHQSTDEYYIKYPDCDFMYKICDSYTIRGEECNSGTKCMFVHSNTIFENLNHGYLQRTTAETFVPVEAFFTPPARHNPSRMLVKLYRMTSKCRWGVIRGRESGQPAMPAAARRDQSTSRSRNGYTDRNLGRGRREMISSGAVANGRGRSGGAFGGPNRRVDDETWSGGAFGGPNRRVDEESWPRASSPVLPYVNGYYNNNQRRSRGGRDVLYRGARSKSNSPTSDYPESITSEGEGTSNLFSLETDKLLTEYFQKKYREDNNKGKECEPTTDKPTEVVSDLIDLWVEPSGGEHSTTPLTNEDKRDDQNGETNNKNDVFMCKTDELLFGEPSAITTVEDVGNEVEAEAHLATHATTDNQNSTANEEIPKIVITYIDFEAVDHQDNQEMGEVQEESDDSFIIEVVDEREGNNTEGMVRKQDDVSDEEKRVEKDVTNFLEWYFFRP